jgi:hypothetical protein
MPHDHHRTPSGLTVAQLALTVLVTGGCSDSTNLNQVRSSPGPSDAAVEHENGGTAGDGGGTAAGQGGAGKGGAAGSDSGGALANGGSGGEPPRITLPARPVWQPTLPLGAPGWRSSTIPFCSEEVAKLSPSVWSTPGAVYVLVGSNCNALDGTPCNVVSSDYSTANLYKNDGSGWQRIYRRIITTSEPGFVGITGFPDGRVLMSGEKCAVLQVDDLGVETCLWPGAVPFSYGRAAVVEGTALLVLGDSLDVPGATGVWKFDGSSWTSLRTWTNDMPVALAAGAGTAVAAGYNLLAWTFDLASGAGSALPGVPASDYTSAWTYGPTSTLLANVAGGIAHNDGSKWTTLDTHFNDMISGMWGAADGTVFLFSQANFGRWNAGTFVPTFAPTSDGGAYPSHYFVDMWGNSPTEVFLAVNDRAFGGYTCGTTFLVWFDGQAFHQF